MSEVLSYDTWEGEIVQAIVDDLDNLTYADADAILLAQECAVSAAWNAGESPRVAAQRILKASIAQS